MITSRFLRILLAIWPVALGAAFIIGVNRLEHAFFPVVEDFTITSMERQGNQIKVAGYMRKVRACAFVGIAVNGHTEDGSEIGLRLSFADSHYRNITRPTGSQDWGPWSLVLPVTPDVRAVHMDAVHDCHMAWPTRTHLATFPVPKHDSTASTFK